MADREKVIEGLEYLIAAYAFSSDDAQCLGDAVELLKEQEYARCLNCQFRDFGENEVDSWDTCKLHRHNTSPDEYCSWFVEREGEVG